MACLSRTWKWTVFSILGHHGCLEIPHVFFEIHHGTPTSDGFTIFYCELGLLEGAFNMQSNRINISYPRTVCTSHHISQQPQFTTHNFPPGQIPGEFPPIPGNLVTSDASS